MIEVWFEVLGDIVPGPSTDRGRLLWLSTVGLAGLMVSAWVSTFSNDPMNEPTWAFGALSSSVVMSGGGAVLAVWHLIRYRSEIAAAVVCLALNAAAAVVPCAVLLP